MMRALPYARTADPGTAPPLRWGVLGSGWIAERFVAALHRSTTQRVTAVASRSASRARDFAVRLDLPASFGSYQELLATDVDVVYIATEHTAHVGCASLALEAGKPVLVEKPLAVNAADAAALAALAADRGLFCMEAMWTCFLPKFDVLRQLLEGGMLGDVTGVLADNGENLTSHRRAMDPAMAGGPMLDLGTYVFDFARWVMGPLQVVAASGQRHPRGVNGQLSALLAHAAGGQAVLHTTVLGASPTTATIIGTAATLVLDGPFYQPGAFRVQFRDGDVLTYDEPAISHDALYWQAAEVARCVAAGRLESPLRPLSETVATLQLMDGVRERLGIRYPGE